MVGCFAWVGTAAVLSVIIFGALRRGSTDCGEAAADAVPSMSKSNRHYNANLDKYSKSQLGEEAVVLRELFQHQGRVFVQGTFVEIGALDGMSLSNTRMLQYALDWSGVLIEACPTHWPILTQRAQRRALPRQGEQLVQTVQSAVCHPSPPGGTIPFSVRCRPSSGVKDGITRGDTFIQRSRTREEADTVDVPCRGLGHILKSHGVRHVDFLSIDVEGYEVPLLHSMDWSTISVYAIVIEVDHNSPDEVSEIHSILSRAGFDLVGLLAGDAIWVRPSALDRSAGHWAIGKVTDDRWKGHTLIRPGLGLTQMQRKHHRMRDAAKETTEFIRYVERVAEGLPARTRTPPPVATPRSRNALNVTNVPPLGGSV